MTLDDELAKLHCVQKIDAQIYQREQAIKALDSGALLKQKAIGLMQQYDTAKEKLQKAEAALRVRELELKSVEQKRAVVHEKLYGGRIVNPKELGDLQKDEEMLDTQVDHIEEAVLELMEQAEEARKTEAKLHVEFDAAKRKWQEVSARTQAETTRLQKEIAALRPQREQAATLIEKPLLRQYDGIRERREGIGLAATASDMCPACHMKLTSRVMDRLREGEELTLCESCARILYFMRKPSETPTPIEQGTEEG